MFGVYRLEARHPSGQQTAHARVGRQPRPIHSHEAPEWFPTTAPYRRHADSGRFFAKSAGTPRCSKGTRSRGVSPMSMSTNFFPHSGQRINCFAGSGSAPMD